ncbi:DUF3021 domain-containing protein [Lactobacillaceae bacterium Scapto_B20]
MNRVIKLFINYTLIGMSIGSLVYLLNIVGNQRTVITQSEIISLLIMSGLIGDLSFIFWWHRLPFILQLLIHYLCTVVLVFITGLYNHWVGGLVSYLIWFTGTYVIIWAVQYYQNARAADSVNHLIQKRKDSQK